jgi:hypothetical protein
VTALEPSPFPYYGPLDPSQVTGREELVRDLAERLMEHRVTALLGPRRYGKTSVLRKVCADLEGVGPQTVWVDLYELSSLADLAGALDQGMSRVQGRLRRAFDTFAGAVSLRLGVVDVELSKGRRDRPDPAATVRSLLGVLVRTAEKHPLIVVFDEFSGIANVEHGAGMLRTALQHHYRQLGIVFAGSQPSTMRMLFTDQAQPFFAQADLVEIGPLSDEAVTDIVEDGFEATGRATGGMTIRLVVAAEGHPQRAMQLADALWRRTPEGGVADETAWVTALDDVRVSIGGGLERLYALLPAGHQKAMRAVAADGRVYGRSAEVLELSPGTAAAAVEALVGSGDLTRRGERLVIIDPMFADWIRRRFPLPS